MPKTRSFAPAVDWKLRISSEVALAVELRYMDPTSHRANYGTKSRLVTALLREFIEKVKELETTHPQGVIKQMLDRIITDEMEKTS